MMTKEQAEYMDKTAQLAALKAANALKDQLPCKEHIEKIDDHDNILHNGLKESVRALDKNVEKLNKKLDQHEKQHDEEQREKIKGRRAFWRAVAIGVGISAFGTLFGFMVKTLLGGG